MKAKTTFPIFSHKDFAISIVNATISKYFLFAMSFVFSVGAIAQPGNLYNGRNIITSHPGPQVSTPGYYYPDYLGVAPFSVNAKNARMQFLYTASELKGTLNFDEKAKTGDKITKIAFHVQRHDTPNSIPTNLINVTIRVGTTATNISNWSNSETSANGTYLPVYSAVSTPILTEVFSGAISIIGMNDIANDSPDRWIEFPFSSPYIIAANNSMIVELSYSYGPDHNPDGSEVIMSSSKREGSFMTRGCYSDGPELGKDLFSDTESPNATAVTGTGSRKLRPWTKFTFAATAENSQGVYFEPIRSDCLGDDVIIKAENLYASDYTRFKWEVSNAPDTGFLEYTGEYVNTLPKLTIAQPAETTYIRFVSFVGLEGSAVETTMLQGVRTLAYDAQSNTNKWIDNDVPEGSESAYFKVAPAASDPIWTSDNTNLCSIKIADGVQVVVPTGKTLILDRSLEETDIEGTARLIFENNSSLLQGTSEPNFNTKVEYKRTTPLLNRYDFTYYSSPVANTTLVAVSPETLSDKYYSYFNDQWVIEPGNTVMTAGKGYLIRAPQTYEISGNPLPFNASFDGIPHNGPVAVNINSTVGAYNLIGNPYPSTVDADKFVLANTSLDGTIYLWRHIHAPSLIPGTHFYGYNNSDYLTVNNLGSTDGPTDFKVAAGQSFMIKTATVPTAPAQWTNIMRVGNNTPTFHKMQSSNPATQHRDVTEASGRFWLEFKGNAGAAQRILVGYVEGATENYDRMYDAEQINSGNISFYTIANDQQHLAITAKGLPFNREDVIPLGFSTTVAGNHTISKFLEDGFMSEYAVYLNDKLTNTVHNLSESNYTFATATGTFNDRFVIAYKLKTTNLGDAAARPNKVVIFDQAEAVQLHSGQDLINTVVVYDLSGRVLVRALNCNSAEVALSNLPRKNQLLVVEIQLENGTVETQKFRF